MQIPNARITNPKKRKTNLIVSPSAHYWKRPVGSLVLSLPPAKLSERPVKVQVGVSSPTQSAQPYFAQSHSAYSYLAHAFLDDLAASRNSARSRVGVNANSVTILLVFHVPMFDRYRRTILQLRGVHRLPRSRREADVDHVAWRLLFAVAAILCAFLRRAAFVAIARTRLVFLVLLLFLRLLRFRSRRAPPRASEGQRSIRLDGYFVRMQMHILRFLSVFSVQHHAPVKTSVLDCWHRSPRSTEHSRSLNFHAGTAACI